MKNNIFKYVAVSICALIMGILVSLIIRPLFTSHTDTQISKKIHQTKEAIKSGYYEKLDEKKWGADFEEYIREIQK